MTDAERSRYATVPRGPRDVPDGRAHAALRLGHGPAPAPVDLDRAAAVDEPAGEAEPVEPRGRLSAEKKGGLRGNVGRDAVLGGHGHVAPGCARGTGGGRIDEVMLQGAASSPGADGDAARRESPLAEQDAPAPRQAHLDGDGGGEVAAGANPAGALQFERVVDSLRP